MNHWYTDILDLANLQDLLTAIDGDDIFVAALDDKTGEAGWVFLDDCPTPLDFASVTGNDLSDGYWTADDAVFPSIADGDTVVALVVGIDSGSPATSRLALFIERSRDTTFISSTSTGNGLKLEWRGPFARI